jgi:thiamine phosphate synthase YjbQ (UPF0047 family)
MARLSDVRSTAIRTIASATLTVETHGPGFTDVTRECAAFLREAGARDGVLLCFMRHTSASLTIQENADPDVQTDLVTALERLAPANGGWVHDTEGPDDMPGGRWRDGARHLAGHLSGGASRTAAPARDRASVCRQRVIPKSGNRFSDKITRKRKDQRADIACALPGVKAALA